MSPHQNRVAGWINSHGAPLLHGQGHQRGSLSSVGGFVQDLVHDQGRKQLNCFCSHTQVDSPALHYVLNGPVMLGHSVLGRHPQHTV